MKSKTKVKNQGEQLKVKRTNYPIPPYRKTTSQEQQRYEQSNQLSIIPTLHPTTQQLIQHQQVQKPKQIVKTRPNPTPTPKKDLKKQLKEMKEWLDGIQIH